MIIQGLLLAALLLAALLLMRAGGSTLALVLRRAFLLGGLACAALAVLFPSALTHVARALGVGRGADLVLYLLCVSFLFVAISVYRRLADLHDRYVELVRHVALLEADARERADEAPQPLPE